MIKVKFKSTKVGAKLPTYGTAGAAGADLYAVVEEDFYILQRGQRWTCPTGIAIEIPDGYEGQVRSRSGLAAKCGISVLNSPGTIDCDYRGELLVILHNSSQVDFTVKTGDRIAQIIFAPVTRAEMVWDENFTETERGDKGHGSTGGFQPTDSSSSEETHPCKNKEKQLEYNQVGPLSPGPAASRVLCTKGRHYPATMKYESKDDGKVVLRCPMCLQSEDPCNEAGGGKQYHLDKDHPGYHVSRGGSSWPKGL